MSKKLDPMDLKQIIRLHIDKYSNRAISKTLGIGRNTINNYCTQNECLSIFTFTRFDPDSILDVTWITLFFFELPRIFFKIFDQ